MLSLKNEKEILDGMEEIIEDTIDFLDVKNSKPITKFKIDEADRNLYGEVMDIFRMGALTQIATNSQSKRLMVSRPFANEPMKLLYGYDDEMKATPMDDVLSKLKNKNTTSLKDTESSCLDTFFSLSESLMKHYHRQYEYMKGDMIKLLSTEFMAEDMNPNKELDDKINEHFLIWKPFVDKENMKNIGIEVSEIGVGFNASKCTPLYKSMINANKNESIYIDLWVKHLAEFSQNLLTSGFDKRFLDIASIGFEEKTPILLMKPSKRLMK